MKKNLTADFSKGNEKAYVRGLYQHDYGAILKVTGIEYTEIIRVDFAGPNDEKAHPVVALQESDGGFCVKIPKEKTDKAGELSAYIYVTDAEAGFTIKEVILPIIGRVEADPDPSGEKTDPFAEAIEEIKKNAKSASDSAASAAESEKSASESAMQAEKAKEAAELFAEAAAASEEAAGISEKNAAESERQARESAAVTRSAADQAAKSATDAAESETTAAKLSQSAERSATDSSGSAKSASQSAETAKTAADAAGKSASSAQQASRSATESASTATAAAQTATTAAGNAAESVTLANQSAETAGQKATAAETAASSAADSATEAGKSATAAGDSASAAKASEITAGEAAQQAQEQAEKIKDSTEQIEKNKADVDLLNEDLEISLLENDRLYEGTNLAEKFKDEIANYSDIWQWIKARIKAGNFAGIHVNDFIHWQTTDNKWIESHIAGINTYKRYGDREVPNHIDFISKDLWPTLHVMNSVNYNNGIIPIENLSGDGTKTAFVLTNEMAAVASVTIGGTATTAYTHDADTHTITFTESPAAGTNNIVVTGTGSEYPWLASDLYLYANSLKGHVAGGTSKTSPVKLVDYTKDGIWSKLPEALKSVIVTKRVLLPRRYSASGVLSNNNSWGWQDMGKLWIPSEIEVYGHGVWADNPCDKGEFVQYPIFNCNMRRIKGLGDGGSRRNWWLISACAGIASSFCYVDGTGNANNAIASSTGVGLPACFRITA